MADKEQIIIDGCNVSGCVQFTQEGDCCNLGGGCKGWPNCYFKQLARKTQECKTLASQLDFEVQKKECLEQECEELKENIKTIFKTLIVANDFNIGAIQDTIWVDNYTTLWDYIRIILNMDDKQFEEFEKQATKQIEELKAYAQRQENQREVYYKEYLKKDKALKEIETATKINCEEICGRKFTDCKDTSCFSVNILDIINKAKDGKNE